MGDIVDEIIKEYILVKELVGESRFEEAIKKARNAKDKNERIVFLCMISEAMVYKGKKEDAILLLNEAFEIAKGIDDEPTKSSNMNMISSRMAFAGRVEDAIKIAESIEDDNEKLCAMTKISNLLMERDENEKAEEVLKKAEEIIYEMKDSILKILSIKDLAHFLLEIGKENEALNMIRYAESIAGKMNEENASISLSSIAPLAIEMRRFDYAMKLIENIKEEYNKAWLLSDIAYGEKDVNLLRKAAEIARGMEPTYEKISVMVKIAYMMSDLGRRKEAKELFNESIEISAKIENEMERAMAMAVISYELFKNGDERYDGMLKQAIEIAANWDKFELEFAGSLIAGIMIETGKFEEALKFMEKIESEETKMAVYLSVVDDLLEKGRKGDALRIAKFFDDKILEWEIIKRKV